MIWHLTLLGGDIELEAENEGLIVRFKYFSNSFHANSLELREALYKVAQKRIISFNNPEYDDIFILINRDETDGYFKGLPGNKKMYIRLAKKLIEYYRNIQK